VLNKRDKRSLVAAQMKVLRPLIGYKKSDQRNVDIRERKKIQSIVK
jgi:hypothetical protein